MSELQANETKRLIGRVLQIIRFCLLIWAIIDIGQDQTLRPTLVLGVVFFIGFWLSFRLRHYEIEKPYYSLWIRSVNTVVSTSMMCVLLYREWVFEDATPILLLIAAIIWIIRSVATPIYSVALIRQGKTPIPPSFWSKLARLSIIVSIGVYTLRLEHYKQISMVSTLLLTLASGLAFLYKYYRDPDHRKPLSIASQLTVSRIILTPVFIWVFFYDNDLMYQNNHLIFKVLALLMVLVFMVTDFLDGYLARKLNEVSVLGKFLDPFSDKISNMTIFLCFMASDYASIWMVALIYFREASVETLRTLAASQNMIIAARQSGKWKTAIQGFGICLILTNAIAMDLFPSVTFPGWLPYASMWAITFVTLASGVDYFYNSRKILSKFL